MKAGITAPRVPPFERIARANGSFGYAADWSDSKHHYRRLASEFIGTYGFVFALAGAQARSTLTRALPLRTC